MSLPPPTFLIFWCDHNTPPCFCSLLPSWSFWSNPTMSLPMYLFSCPGLCHLLPFWSPDPSDHSPPCLCHLLLSWSFWSNTTYLDHLLNYLLLVEALLLRTKCKVDWRIRVGHALFLLLFLLLIPKCSYYSTNLGINCCVCVKMPLGKSIHTR